MRVGVAGGILRKLSFSLNLWFMSSSAILKVFYYLISAAMLFVCVFLAAHAETLSYRKDFDGAEQSFAASLVEQPDDKVLHHFKYLFKNQLWLERFFIFRLAHSALHRCDLQNEFCFSF